MPGDPDLAAPFTMHLGGAAVSRFQSIEGLGAHIDTIPFRQGGAARGRHLPDKVKVSPVILRHGVTSDGGLWNWCNATATGNIICRTVLVTLTSNDGSSEAARWTFFGAWPSSFRAVPLEAHRDDIAFEALTLVYDQMQRD